jgi:CheY-like chemotaxis protein
MKILCVEDNEDNVYMLKNRLTRAGFTVVIATNGKQGIAMASSEQPDLILMDLTHFGRECRNIYSRKGK